MSKGCIPIHQDFSAYRVLAIGAHPDDVEHGCGGTLIKLARQKADISLCIVTDGSAGAAAEIRQKEQSCAAEILGVNKVFWGGVKDTQVSLSKNLIDRLDTIIAEVKPTEVYVNWPEDTHQDHMNLARAAMVAARYVKRVIFYEAYTSQNFSPNFFVDITPVLDEKTELMKCHKSQVKKPSPAHIDMIESMQAVARFRGFQGNVQYAEGFKLLRFLRGI